MQFPEARFALEQLMPILRTGTHYLQREHGPQDEPEIIGTD